MKILLGAIVTQMAGSIGGQTVRRSQNGQIFYNKSQKRNISTFSNSAQQKRLQRVMTNYLKLSALNRDGFATESTKNIYINRFGQQIFLKPYNYYVSTASTALLFGNTSDLIYTLSSVIPPIDILITSIEVFSKNIIFTNTTPDPASLIIIRVAKNKTAATNPSVKQSKILYAGTNAGLDGESLYDTLSNLYPSIDANQEYTFWVQSVAPSYYSGTPVFNAKILAG